MTGSSSSPLSHTTTPQPPILPPQEAADTFKKLLAMSQQQDVAIQKVQQHLEATIPNHASQLHHLQSSVASLASHMATLDGQFDRLHTAITKLAAAEPPTPPRAVNPPPFSPNPHASPHSIHHHASISLHTTSYPTIPFTSSLHSVPDPTPLSSTSTLFTPLLPSHNPQP